jgi:cobalt/nickel transport system permease protein
LKDIASFVKEALVVEYIPESILSRLDARIKLISLIIFLVSISFLKGICSLLILYVFSVLLAFLSDIDTRLFFKRTWLFIPVFTLFIAIPSLFIVPGRLEFGFTVDGLIVAIRLVLRVVTSISYTMLVILTTRWMKLISSLRALGIPEIFVSIASMSYRYIFLLLELAEKLYLAKKMRTIKTDIRQEQRWIGSTIGILTVKTQYLSREVYQGMMSRGFNKDMLYLRQKGINLSDFLIIILTLVINVSILYLDKTIR